MIKEMWKTPGMRKKLEKKLVRRWKTENPTVVELGQTREEVSSIFCNDRHVFCGQHNGSVGVYQLDGQWVRDLTPTERMEGQLFMAGSDGVLAAWSTGGDVLTVWATKGQMEELHSFQAIKCLSKVDSDHGVHLRITEVKVIDQSKIALLVTQLVDQKASLVFLKRVEQVWEEKIVASFLC